MIFIEGKWYHESVDWASEMDESETVRIDKIDHEKSELTLMDAKPEALTPSKLLDAYAAIYRTASFRVNRDGDGLRVILSNEDCCTMGCDRCIAVMSKKPRFVSVNETLDGAMQDLYAKLMESADR